MTRLRIVRFLIRSGRSSASTGEAMTAILISSLPDENARSRPGHLPRRRQRCAGLRQEASGDPVVDPFIDREAAGQGADLGGDAAFDLRGGLLPRREAV